MKKEKSCLEVLFCPKVWHFLTIFDTSWLVVCWWQCCKVLRCCRIQHFSISYQQQISNAPIANRYETLTIADLSPAQYTYHMISRTITKTLPISTNHSILSDIRLLEKRGVHIIFLRPWQPISHSTPHMVSVRLSSWISHKQLTLWQHLPM